MRKYLRDAEIHRYITCWWWDAIPIPEALSTHKFGEADNPNGFRDYTFPLFRIEFWPAMC